MVDTKDQSNALCIVYAMLFVNAVDMKIKACNAFNAIYVNTVDTKHIHTFLPITFLIFNRFSIQKMFWKAETQGFSTIPSNTIYVDTVVLQVVNISNAFNAIYVEAVDTFSTLYTHVMVCMLMQLIQLNYNVDSSTKYSNYMKIQLKALNYFELQQTSK